MDKYLECCCHSDQHLMILRTWDEAVEEPVQGEFLDYIETPYLLGEQKAVESVLNQMPKDSVIERQGLESKLKEIDRLLTLPPKPTKKETFLSFNIQMGNFGLWRRIVNAIKYILKIDGYCYHWEEVLINKEKSKEIVEFLNEAYNE